MTHSKVLTALALVLLAQPTFANSEVPIPEPGIVPLLAMGAAVGMFLHWRSKRKK